MSDFNEPDMREGLKELVIQETVKKAETHVQTFRRCIQSWFDGREYLLEMIDEIVEELDEHYRNVHIAKATGAGVSAVGIGVTFAGFLFPPAALVGIGTMVAGSITTTGAAITGAVIEKGKRDDIRELIIEDREKFEKAQAAMGEINVIVQNAIKELPSMSADQIKGCIFAGGYAAQTGAQVVIFAAGLARAKSAGSITAGALDGMSAAMAAGETLAAVGRIASKVVVVASIPLTAASLIVSIKALYEESSAPTSKDLIQLKKKLVTEYTEVKKAYDKIVGLCKKIHQKGSKQSNDSDYDSDCEFNIVKK